MKCRLLIAALVLAVLAPVAHAEHANIDLRLIRVAPGTGQNPEETTASADTEPPAGGVNPRPLAKVRAGEPLVLQFFFTNTYPHGDIKDAGVRYYVVREEKPRQKQAPDPSRGTVLDGKFRLNLKPKARVGARVAFTIKEPGTYLLRVESFNTGSDHEHFSAIDVQVE